MFNFFKKKKTEVKLFYHTDVHCHILCGVDHGSQSPEQSLQMLTAQQEMGIERIIFTSHTTAHTFENTPQTLTSAYEKFLPILADSGLPIETALSSEYRIDDYFMGLWERGEVLPMPGKHILLENSFMQELIGIDNLLFNAQVKGFFPILAHPERYPYYHDRRERYKQLHNMGVKFQLNILSLAGYFGKRTRDVALWLIENNLADLFGSDMHNMDHAETISEYISSKDWDKLCARYKLPERILNDRIWS